MALPGPPPVNRVNRMLLLLLLLLTLLQWMLHATAIPLLDVTAIQTAIAIRRLDASAAYTVSI